MSVWRRLLGGPDALPAIEALGRPLREQVSMSASGAAPTEEERLWSPLRGAGVEEDYYWRRLSDNWYQKDVVPSTYLEIHNRCYEAYNANPLAARVVDLITDFVLGDTVTVEAAAPRVQAAIDRFWFDPENHMDTRVHALVTELSLYGEQFVRYFVNPLNGQVKIGQIDPSLIDQIETDPDNVERALRFHQRPVGPGGALWSATAPAAGIQAPAPTMEPSQASYPGDQVMAGTWYAAGREVQQFKINAVSNAKRGKSDLATLLPWLRRYQDWLIDRVRINKYKSAFLWDIELSGADAKTIDRKRMQYAYAPAPGSVVVHNESETWTAVQPKIAADDVAADGNAIKMMIAAGAGLPQHYLAEGGDANRACYSEDTETLTEHGWKRFDDIDDAERIATFNPHSGAIEYHRPISRHVYPYSGEMLRFKARGVDVLVTPDHDMWVQIPPQATRTPAPAPAHTPWEKRKAEDLTRTPAFRFLAGADYLAADVETFTLPGSTSVWRGNQPDRTMPMDLWLEFLGYIVSAGGISTNGPSCKVHLCRKHEPHAARLAALLAQLPFAFVEAVDAKHTHRWQVCDRALWMWLREHVGGGCRTKRLPDFIRTLSARQQRVLFEALMLGDGTVDPRAGRSSRTYTTSSPARAGDVQELALRLGMRTHSTAGTRGIRVRCSAVSCRDLRCNHVTRVPYTGIVYCFHVENHLFVTRRNGAVAIHGNTAAEMGLPTYRKLIRRQRLVEQMLRAILDRVIAEGVRAGTIPKSADRAYRIELPQLTPGEDELRASAASTLISALTTAMQTALISRETAMRLFFEIADPALSLADELARIEAEGAAPADQAARRPWTAPAASTGRASAAARAVPHPHPRAAARKSARLRPARPQAGGARGPQ